MSSDVAVTTESSVKDDDQVTQCVPPSHIVQDGRFIHLPEPTDAERSRFLERSIARYKLLSSDLQPGEQKEEDKEDEDTKKATEPTIHPLAVASARLQANGVSELSKAINLSTLVNTGEYFGLSNIVNPILVADTMTATTSKREAGAATTPAGESTASKTATPQLADDSIKDEQRLRSLYIGKRKRSQFQQAETSLDRYQVRLAAAVAAQRIVDQRLAQLRPTWRLVAPEHGTRAKPHSVLATEVVAIDVDVYDRDRTGGGVGASSRGIARRVPRYATIELPKKYNVKPDVAEWKARSDRNRMDVDIDDQKQKATDNGANKTKAEPFAVADPTLGKIDVDFDPDKVPMLTLQLDIQKGSTGFCQSAHLSPAEINSSAQDEEIVVALQHSLFCASLFESIRTELAPCDEEVSSKAKTGPSVWLSSDMEVNFLPPPSVLAGGTGAGGRGALCIVHCHEGEVKVQLDSEYALTIKLVEAASATDDDNAMDVDDNDTDNEKKPSSGSQSPEQLHALCRALLLHAQTVYHRHCLQNKADQAAKKAKEMAATKPAGHLLKQKKETIVRAQILQSCVGLGAKMIFERKVRIALNSIQKWINAELGLSDVLVVEWLSLSLFDLHSQFVVSFQDLTWDVSIDRDEMKVSRFGENGEYRKVDFHSEREFEVFLKMQIRQRLKATSLDDE